MGCPLAVKSCACLAFSAIVVEAERSHSRVVSAPSAETPASPASPSNPLAAVKPVK